MIVLILLIVVLAMKAFASADENADSTSQDFTSHVFFETDKYTITPEFYGYLERLAESLKNDGDAQLELIGYTDNTGSEEYNLLLSELRAYSVAEFLISRGCSSGMLIVKGLGKSNPINANLTSEDRAQNRRTEFKWIKQVKTKELTSANGTVQPVNSTELTGTFSVIDNFGNPFKDLSTEDVSAILKWSDKSSTYTVNGNVKIKPLDANLKLAASLTMDYSPSMYDSNFNYNAPKTKRILEMENGVRTFINTLRECDAARIIKFGTDIDMIQNYTTDRALLLKAVDLRSYPRPGTALFESVFTALSDTAMNYDPTFVKTVISFTDGEENASRSITKESVMNKAQLNGIRVNTIGLLLEESKHSEPPGLNSKFEKDLFDIANVSGGFYYYAPDENKLREIYSSIISQLLSSYSISIIWPEEGLPPKGTTVTAIITVKYQNQTKGFVREYVMN